MDFNKKDIENLAGILKTKDLNNNLKKLFDYNQIAKALMEKYPNLTAEEIGEIYDAQCNKKEANKGQEMAD